MKRSLAILFLAVSAFAADIPWIDGDGYYTNTTKWVGGAAPTIGDTVSFTNLGAAAVVTVDTSITNNSAVVSGTNLLTLSIAPGQILAWTNGNTAFGTNKSTAVKILGGGNLSTTSLDVGLYALASNSVLTITGAGTTWTNTGRIIVGSIGSKCAMLVSNGATVCTDGFEMTTNGLALGSLTVTDAGSVLRVTNTAFCSLHVGFGQYNVLNGGMIVTKSASLGWGGAGTTVDTGTVSGVSSTWSNTGAFLVSSYGSSCLFSITNGGRLMSSTITIGEGTAGTAIGSEVLVSGSNSLLGLSGQINIASLGTRNRLVVSNGATAYNTACYIGGVRTDFTANSNYVIVTDSGSMLSNTSSIYIGGAFRSLCSLSVLNGGITRSLTAYVGSYDGIAIGSNNLATVSGAGSQWLNASNMFVGTISNLNAKLTVSFGGLVNNGSNLVVFGTGASNSMLVTLGGKVTCKSLQIR